MILQKLDGTNSLTTGNTATSGTMTTTDTLNQVFFNTGTAKQ